MIFLAIYAGSKKKEGLPCWRSSFLSASIIWGILLTLSTEVLSIFNLITFSGVLGFWVLACLVCMLFVWRLWRGNSGFLNKSKTRNLKRTFRRSEIMLLSGIAFIIIIVGLIALLTPPNGWDSMNYRMSRVFHWIQNKNIAPYPTNILRQLTYTPGLEFVIAHFQILSGGDHFANLVQWLCMLGSVIGVSLIAREFGADRRGQIFSALFCATIPMGILQGSSTQADYAASFWIISFVYYILLISRAGPKRFSLLMAGFSLGLALLAKATAYIYTVPFLIWFIFSVLKKFGRRAWKTPLLIVMCAFFINVGYYIRAFVLRAYPLSRLGFIARNVDFIADRMTAPLFISNVARNIALHLGTPFKIVNNVIYEAIRSIHLVLGVPIDGPRGLAFHIPLSLYEGDAGNFLHFILIAASIVIFSVTYRKKEKKFFYYPALLIAGFFMFCFLIDWAPWHSRYHLPLFVLFCPFVAMAFSGISDRKIINCISFFLILLSLPWLFFNTSRPLIFKMGEFIKSNRIKNIFNTDRIKQYFIMRPELKKSYAEAVRFIESEGHSDIGMILHEYNSEYAFLVLFQKIKDRKFRIEHVKIDNSSSIYYDRHPFKGFNPSAIISLKPNGKNKIVHKEKVYAREWSSGSVSVFIKR